jgi:hypothetical protein
VPDRSALRCMLAPMSTPPRTPASLPSRLALTLAVLVLAGSAAGCRAEITADLQVDGGAFEPTSCESGQRASFTGVDLIDNSGRKIRLVLDPTMKPSAILIAGAQVVELGECGSLSVERQNSVVNDITNIRGEATLDCEAQGHTVKGTVTFANCH